MTARCPAEHASTTTDFCDECGVPIDDDAVRAPPSGPTPSGPTASGATRVTRVARCPSCGHPLQAGDQFCEQCGGSATALVDWVATIEADRAHYEALGACDLPFPDDAREPRTVALTTGEVTIGRRPGCDIDLGAPLEDPAVSRSHACLRRQADGAFAVVDLGSANGTRLNGAPDPITEGVPVVLTAGDRIHVGAWTTITISTIPRGQGEVTS